MKVLLASLTAIGVALGAGAAFAQAGSGASAPTAPTVDTRPPSAPRSPTLGDPGPANDGLVRPRPRPRPRPPAASTQNGTAVDRAAGAGGAR